MRRMRIEWLCLAGVLAVLMFTHCASTATNYDYDASSGETEDIDELLGLSSEDDSIGEDDVMQLLGIAEEAATEAAFDAEATEQAPDELKQELNTLEMQHSDLDQKTRELEQKVGAQEETIAGLEQTMTSPVPTSVPARPVSQSGYAADYKNAFKLYKDKQYPEAIQQFESLLTKDASHGLSDNAQYWIGESYYAQGNYQQAVISFEKVFAFTKSNKDDAAQLKIGMCYLRMNDKAKAREEFQKLIDNYPTSESVPLAKRLLDRTGSADAGAP